VLKNCLINKLISENLSVDRKLDIIKNLCHNNFRMLDYKKRINESSLPFLMDIIDM